MPDAWAAAAAAATAAVVLLLPLPDDDDDDGDGEEEEEVDAVDLTAPGLCCEELLCECWVCVAALLWARKATSRLAKKGRFVGISWV